jgi:hypothetical protein
MGPSQVIGGTETDPSRYIKTSLGSIGFSPAPGLEISCEPGRSLVLFLEPTRINLAPRPGRPADNSTTNFARGFTQEIETDTRTCSASHF